MVESSGITPDPRADGSTNRLVPVALGLGLIVAAFVVAFFPTLKWMAGEWSASNGVMSHGYLIVAISVVLFVKALPSVARADFRRAWWLLPFLIGMSVVWLLSYVATVVAVQTVLLPPILLTAVLSAFGFRAARPLVFAVLFLYFAVPAWAHLQFIFQAITVFVVGLLIRAADMPALLYGNFVQLASGTFEIAGGCSGLNFIVAGLSLAVLYSYLYYDSLRQWIALVGLMLFAAMLGNWIRVFVIIMIGYKTEMQSSLVDDHYTLGWILFAILLIPVFFIARRLEGDHAPAKARQIDDRAGSPRPAAGLVLPVGVAILAMVAGPVWALAIARSENAPGELQLELPQGVAGWVGPGESHWGWQPRFNEPTAERLGQFENGAATVLVYSNLYLNQSQDRELIYFNNSVAGSWSRVAPEGGLPGLVNIGGDMTFRQVAARNYAGTWLIWYRYQVGDRFETSDTRAKIVQALQSLRGAPEAGVIAFAAICDPSCAEADATLTKFVGDVGYLVNLDLNRDVK